MRRIWQATIWAKGAIPPEDYPNRNQKRVMYPFIDIVFVLAGFSAARYGVPAISEFFTDSTVDLFAYSIAGAGFACLLGIGFPRLWPLEILAKSALLSLNVLYFVALFMLTAVGEGNRGYVVCIAAVAIAPIVWRITQLSSEWQKRRLSQKADK